MRILAMKESEEWKNLGERGQHEAIWLKLNTCKGSCDGIQICQITI